MFERRIAGTQRPFNEFRDPAGLRPVPAWSPKTKATAKRGDHTVCRQIPAEDYTTRYADGLNFQARHREWLESTLQSCL